MYTDPKIQESIRKVEAARAENGKLSPARMSAEEKENLLKTFHPDYRENQFTTLRIGPNKGGKVPLEWQRCWRESPESSFRIRIWMCRTMMRTS